MYAFHIYFLSVLCVIIQLKRGISQEYSTTEAETASDVGPTYKCSVNKCTCADIPKWNGVSCNDNNFYWSKSPTLWFHRFKYLPEKMFQGLSIMFIALQDPDLTVAENFLEGILSLQIFKVTQSSIKDIPDFRFVSHSLTMIDFLSSRLTALEGKHLQNLTKVHSLSFRNNSIQYIDPDVFKGTENLMFLYLDNNLLTSIPPKLLEPMKKLYIFTASHNNLLHADGFAVAREELKIELAFNKISSVNFSQLFKLEEDWRPIQVEILDLSYNLIKENSLSLSSCDTNKSPVVQISKLHLNGNQLQHLNDCLRCSRMTILEISGNQLQFLTETDFVSVYDAKDLRLRDNQIHSIDTHTFKPINGSLVYLDLSSNKITSINGSIRYLSQLESLKLSYNAIQTFAEDEFAGLYKLSELLLQHNQLKVLRSLHQLVNLKVLNVAENDIKLIKPSQVPDTLERIFLADNPFQCACHIQSFIDFMKERQKWGFFQTDTGICLQSGPRSSRRNLSNCPDTCSCKCIDYGDERFILIDCGSRNLSRVPQLMNKERIESEDKRMPSDDEDRLLIQDNTNSDLLLADKALGINLENNSLESLDEVELPPHLVELYLSNNHLKRFPDSILNNQLNLKQVSLSRNPWSCDCRALKFKTWLASNSRIITDFDNIRCGIGVDGETKFDGLVMWKLKDLDLCPGIDIGLILSVFLGVLALFTICLASVIFYLKNEQSIKIFLYSHGFTFVKEEVIDKAFDAFISFAHQDDEFVIKEIVSEIEKRDPNIRLCLHYRHFRPGELITTNITRAVQSSTRTVLIVSRNFLESEWCILEYETAHLQTLRDKTHRVIAIIVGELPEEIDPTVKVYLENTTYLTWGESNFWNKVMFVLPTGSSVRSPVLRFVEENETVF